jgi:DNA polymerase
MEHDQSSLRLMRDLSAWLRFQKELGVETVPNSPGIRDFLTRDAGRKTTPTPKVPGTDPSPSEAAADLPQSLSEVRELLGDCRRCGLHARRRRIVFGEGPQRARIMLVGEAPGREEDIQGTPFVGAAGDLLTKMLHAIDLAREEVFIANVLKCRPPGNRNPNAEEIRTCSPFLLHQIRVISPPLLLALGQVAAHTLLGTKGSLASLRGRFHPHGGTRILVTYHPAFLLRLTGERQRAFKREAWNDLQMLQKACAELV